MLRYVPVCLQEHVSLLEPEHICRLSQILAGSLDYLLAVSLFFHTITAWINGLHGRDRISVMIIISGVLARLVARVPDISGPHRKVGCTLRILCRCYSIVMLS